MGNRLTLHHLHYRMRHRNANARTDDRTDTVLLRRRRRRDCGAGGKLARNARQCANGWLWLARANNNDGKRRVDRAAFGMDTHRGAASRLAAYHRNATAAVAGAHDEGVEAIPG